MMLKLLPTIFKTKTNTLIFNYHMLTLLQSKHPQQFVKTNPALFNLYMHKLLHSAFDQRYTVMMIMDCYRSSQSRENFDLIAEHALNNLKSFSSRVSLVNLLQQMYHYKYSNKQQVIKITEKVLQIKEEQDAGNAFYNLKLLISVDQLVGLEHFDQKLLRAIDFRRFKPLMLAMTLELFCSKNLQNKFTLVDEIVDMFVACESFIPFADMHHLAYSIRKINNQKFKQCYFRVRRRMQMEVGGRQSQESESPDEELTQQKLLQRFRQNIMEKYAVDR